MQTGNNRGFRVQAVRSLVAVASAGVALTLYSLPGGAQQVSGKLGSPGATTTISGKQLPPPDPKFGGVIKEKATDSTPWWPPRVVPPKGAPNVLLIMTDDCGFGAPGTFGGVVPTPALDRIAKVQRLVSRRCLRSVGARRRRGPKPDGPGHQR